MILPHLRQLGAVAKRGCTEALQSQRRRSVDRLGFVESSKAAMAAVRSFTLEVVVVALDLVGVDVPDCGKLCAGFFDCLVRTLGKSDIKLPVADGGNFDRLDNAGETSRDRSESIVRRPPCDTFGSCKASGC